MRGLKTPTARPQWAAAWLQARLGDDYFHNVTYANLMPAVGHTYELTDRDLAPLEALDRLEDLVIVDTPITDAGLAHLEGLTSLTRLILINFDATKPKMHVTDAGVAHYAMDDQTANFGPPRERESAMPAWSTWVG